MPWLAWCCVACTVLVPALVSKVSGPAPSRECKDMARAIGPKAGMVQMIYYVVTDASAMLSLPRRAIYCSASKRTTSHQRSSCLKLMLFSLFEAPRSLLTDILIRTSTSTRATTSGPLFICYRPCRKSTPLEIIVFISNSPDQRLPKREAKSE